MACYLQMFLLGGVAPIGRVLSDQGAAGDTRWHVGNLACLVAWMGCVQR